MYESIKVLYVIFGLMQKARKSEGTTHFRVTS